MQDFEVGIFLEVLYIGDIFLPDAESLTEAAFDASLSWASSPI